MRFYDGGADPCDEVNDIRVTLSTVLEYLRGPFISRSNICLSVKPEILTAHYIEAELREALGET